MSLRLVLFVFIHVNMPVGGNAQGQRATECASGILTKKGGPEGSPA